MGFWDQLKRAASGRKLLDSIDAVEDTIRSTDRAEARRLAREDYKQRGKMFEPTPIDGMDLSREAPEEEPPQADPDPDPGPPAPPPIEEVLEAEPRGFDELPPFELPDPLEDPRTEERFFEIEIREDDGPVPPFETASELHNTVPEIVLEDTGPDEETLPEPPSGESLAAPDAPVIEPALPEPVPPAPAPLAGAAPDDSGFDADDETLRFDAAGFDEDDETLRYDASALARSRDPRDSLPPEPAPAAAPAPAIEPEPASTSAPARFHNSLGLSDAEVVAILREENYPHLDDAPDEALYALSRIEAELVARAEAVGGAFHRLSSEALPGDDLWQAAVWFTGMHRDPMVREGLRRLADEPSEAARCWLGWAVWPYAAELRGASAGLRDPVSLRVALDALDEALRTRGALIRRSPASMAVERHRYPVTLQGIFRREGFRWSRS